MNIYQINKEIESIYENEVDFETGEINPEAVEKLDALNMDREQKIENVALWYKNVLAEAKAIADEIKALQDRKKRLETQSEWQKKYLADALQGQKFSTARCAISYRKSEAVDIENENDFIEHFKDNEELVSKKVEYKPNRAEIKKILKEGGEMLGVHLVEKQNIQIK